MKSIFKIV